MSITLNEDKHRLVNSMRLAFDSIQITECRLCPAFDDWLFPNQKHAYRNIGNCRPLTKYVASNGIEYPFGHDSKSSREILWALNKIACKCPLLNEWRLNNIKS